MSEYLLSKTRLEQFQLDAVLESFDKLFLADDHIWLFGSRADLQARGGDIDLYIETNISDFKIVGQKKHDFIDFLWQKIGEQNPQV